MSGDIEARFDDLGAYADESGVTVDLSRSRLAPASFEIEQLLLVIAPIIATKPGGQ